MKPLRLAVGALSKNVYVGHISKDGTRFLDRGKQDVTQDFYKAVIDRFLEDEETTITCSDGKIYTVRVTCNGASQRYLRSNHVHG